MHATAENPASPLTQKRILLTWLPLAASWLLMALEMPYINAALARLPESVHMIAAFGIAASLSITIESPVISLLATSTALARSPQNYAMLRRFTVQLMVATTLLQALLAWSPLFDIVVKGWMGTPESLLASVKLGLQLMLLWSAAIAWRRFRQGILIRFGNSASVGKGTLVRLLVSLGVATVMAVFTDAPGIATGALALSLGVIAEAIYAHMASAALVSEKFGAASTLSAPELSYGALVNFHWPLAMSNLLFLLTQPLIAAALARGTDPETALAAWPVLNGLFFISRAVVVAIPEVVIAHHEIAGSQPALRRFSYNVGWACTLLLALVAFTPLSDVYFQTLIGVDMQLSLVAEAGARLGVLLPLMVAAVMLSRGLLTAQRNTRPLALSMVLELVVLSAVLIGGTALGLPGVPLAAAGLTLSLATEALYLNTLTQKSHSQPAAVPAQN